MPGLQKAATAAAARRTDSLGAIGRFAGKSGCPPPQKACASSQRISRTISNRMA